MEQTVVRARREGLLNAAALSTPGVRCLLYGLLAVACAVWFAVNLTQLSLWTDEWMTIYYSRSVEATVMDAYHPPLYYAMLWGWRALVPLPVTVTTRAFSLLFLVLTLLLWLHMWRQELGQSRIVPGVALAICLLSPHVILYGRMGRHFTLTAFLAAMTLWWFLQILKGTSLTVTVGMVLSHMMLALEDYWALAVILGAEVLYVAIWKKERLSALVLPVIASGMTIVFCNWLFKLEQATVIDPTGAPISWKSGVIALAYPLWSLMLGENLSWLLLAAAVPAIAAWVAVAARFLPFGRCSALPELVRVGLIILGVMLVGCLAMIAVGNRNLDYLKLQTAKLFFPFAPAVYMLAAYAVVDLYAGAVRWILAIALGSAMLVGTVTHHRGVGFLHPVHNMPWKESAQVLAARTTGSDAVFTVDWAFMDYFSLVGGKATLMILQEDLNSVREGRYAQIWLVTRPIPHAKYSGYFLRVEEAMENRYREMESIQVGEEGPTLVWLRNILTGSGFPYRVTLKRYERIDS